VFKTLVASVGPELVVAVVPVAGELSFKALAAAVGAKNAEMADRLAAERSTGYVAGGISPIGQKRRLPTVIDDSAAKWGTVFVSGGRRGLELELAPTDLVVVTNGRFAHIGRPKVVGPRSVDRTRR
jgi:Cys-tRNA(Pro)/Cys-tRNA(Cys) deacylase